MNARIIRSAFFGLAIGDALGIPAEFKSRQFLSRYPVKDMTGSGTHNMPPGTFSDDSSLAFCLAEALTEGFDLNTIAGNFVNWYQNGYWTAHGEVFDIGFTTKQAINKLMNGTAPHLAGDDDVMANGNGSLMRVLPLLFYIWNKPVEQRYELSSLVSSITHRHIRSVFACFYYLELAREILMGKDKITAYYNLQSQKKLFLTLPGTDPEEFQHFNSLFSGEIVELPQDAIQSSGYVVYTLEAAIWCLMKTGNYRDAVLLAVNLGEDTDTTAAVTGGLAGLLYGYGKIPKEWIRQLARQKDINDLAERLTTSL